MEFKVREFDLKIRLVVAEKASLEEKVDALEAQSVTAKEALEKRKQ